MCEKPAEKMRLSDFAPPAPLLLDSAKMALGQRLFFDPRLSDTDSISCASCHLPERSFSDKRRVSRGIFNREGKRNTPPIINAFSQTHFFHDGRAATLAEQARGPLNDSTEMGNFNNVVPKLSRDKSYTAQFEHVYKKPISQERIVDAIAEFERSLRVANSPFDRFVAGDSSAISEDAKKGFDIFLNKGNCVDCHSGWNLTDNLFHNIAFFEKGNPKSDVGRFAETQNPADFGKFKTPTLRNVALTAPYFVNGKTPTLKAVIDLYNKPNPMGFGQLKDPLIKPIHLTELESYQLLQFLHALTDTKTLQRFASAAAMDSVIAAQNIPKAEFERGYYLPEYARRIEFFKEKFAADFRQMPFSRLENPSDAEKIEFTKSVLMGSHKTAFESGEHLIRAERR